MIQKKFIIAGLVVIHCQRVHRSVLRHGENISLIMR